MGYYVENSSIDVKLVWWARVMIIDKYVCLSPYIS